jgi:hypothetical protein
MTRPLAITLGGRRVCRPAPVLALSIMLAAFGCGEDPTSPTTAESEPALATTSTHALAFYQVSAGGVQTCGLTTDNRAYCWGYNAEGALGDGTTTTRLRPVPVAGGE